MKKPIPKPAASAESPAERKTVDAMLGKGAITDAVLDDIETKRAALADALTAAIDAADRKESPRRYRGLDVLRVHAGEIFSRRLAEIRAAD